LGAYGLGTTKTNEVTGKQSTGAPHNKEKNVGGLDKPTINAALSMINLVLACLSIVEYAKSYV